MDYKKNALDLFAYLDDQDANLNITKLQVLLIVASRRDCTVRDIVELTGKSQPTICRVVGDLGDQPTRTSVPGLNWVKAYPDPADPRRVLINLGKDGHFALKEMRNFFED